MNNDISPDEAHLINLLRQEVSSYVSLDESIEISTIESEWSSNIDRLFCHIMNDDPRNLLTWDVVLSTMFVADQPYIPIEFRFLQNNPKWRKKWSKAIKESPFGQPIFYPKYKKTSENVIHHAYHIAQWEKFANINVDEIDLVLEFGGGYGSMCRLFYNLGFQGKYVIYDLPIMSALQRYYLESLGIGVISDEKIKKDGINIICTSSIETVETLCSNDVIPNSLFIATWSLSEVPLRTRQELTGIIHFCSHFLVAYQERFGNIDNKNYFSDWPQKFHESIYWRNWGIEHLPGSYYLMGKTIFNKKLHNAET